MNPRLGLLLLIVSFAPGVAAADAIWDVVRAPGTVIVVRHSFSPGSTDPPGMSVDDCATQRNLDDAGRAQAERMGAVFRDNGVTVGVVLSSPLCRSLDTARLAFGRAEPWPPLQGFVTDPELQRRQLAAIRRRMSRHRDGPPLVFVTHGDVISGLTGLTIQMGEFVVLRRTDEGTRSVAGHLYVK